jgi:hypothetical protein
MLGIALNGGSSQTLYYQPAADTPLQEFPDVFAFPRLVTTRHPEEARRYRADLPDLEEEPQPPAAAADSAAADSQRAGAAGATTDGSTGAAQAGTGPGSGQAAGDSSGKGSPWPEPQYMPPEQFQAAVAQGGFVQHGPELFVHQQVSAQWGVTAEALREVIASGRLPLLEMEVEGVEMVKASKVLAAACLSLAWHCCSAHGLLCCGCLLPTLLVPAGNALRWSCLPALPR